MVVVRAAIESTVAENVCSMCSRPWFEGGDASHCPLQETAGHEDSFLVCRNHELGHAEQGQETWVGETGTDSADRQLIQSSLLWC